MTERELTAVVSNISVVELISFLVAIGCRDISQFRLLEKTFVKRHGVEVWEEYFNFRILPSLDNGSNNWLLEHYLGG